MAGERTHRVYAAEEARAAQELHELQEQVDVLTMRLRARHPDDWELMAKLENAARELPAVATEAVYARLCRIFPHLADAIATACFPDDVSRTNSPTTPAIR